MIKGHFLVTLVGSTGQTHNFGNLRPAIPLSPMYRLLIPYIKPSVRESMIKSHWAPGLYAFNLLCGNIFPPHSRILPLLFTNLPIRHVVRHSSSLRASIFLRASLSFRQFAFSSGALFAHLPSPVWFLLHARLLFPAQSTPSVVGSKMAASRTLWEVN